MYNGTMCVLNKDGPHAVICVVKQIYTVLLPLHWFSVKASFTLSGRATNRTWTSLDMCQFWI
jgi:hypothetical protein